ncbi:winged helix-turn-helix transcriptional regulator, partial [Limosilactobacillus vaginalis]
MTKQTIQCPIERTLKQISGKWKSVIIFRLLEHPRCRFNQLQKLIPECSRRMLALQLKELEHDGLISKTVYPVVPPKT